MKNVFLLFLGISIFACTSQPSESDTGEGEEVVETPEEEGAEASSTTLVSTDSYEIQVLDGNLPSPRKQMTTNLGGADITVNYGSPSIKGRKIWGGLEPYGEVWRTGANEATTFEVSTNINVEGETLAAGKYGLFTIPNEDNWVIIFNSEPDQWGDYKYDESKDVLRVTVDAKEVEEHAEAMEFMVEGENIVLRWGKVAVPFEVTGA